MRRLGGNAFAVAWTVLALAPLLWMFYASLKSLPEFTTNRWTLPESIHLENFVEAWTGQVPTQGSGTSAAVQLPVSRYFINSVIVTLSSVLGVLVLSAPLAYALARLRIRAKAGIYGLLIIGLSMPTEILVLPIWAIENVLGLTNSYLGLILPYIGTSIPFATLVLMPSFEMLSREVEESARVDGASHFVVFTRVAVPMSRPAIAAVGILVTNGVWNDLLYPLVLTTQDKWRTLPVGLFNFSGEYFTPYNVLLAGLVIATLPILVLYLAFQRQIANAFGSGYVRG